MPCDVALSVCDANAQHRSKSSKECRHSNGTEWLDASAEDDARRRARNASGRVVAQGQPLGSCKLIKLPASEAAALKLPQTCFVTAMHIFGEGSPPTAQRQKAAVSIVEFNIGNPRYFTVKLNPNLGFVGREADDADYCFVAPSAEDVGNLPDPCPFEDAETRVRQAGVCFSIFQFPQQQPGMVTTPFSPITICDQFIDHMGQTYLGSSGATYDVQPTYQPVAIHVSGGQGDGDLNRGYKISTALTDAMQQHAQYAGAAADSGSGAAAILPSGAAMLPPVGALVPFQPPPPELGFPVKRRRVFGMALSLPAENTTVHAGALGRTYFVANMATEYGDPPYQKELQHVVRRDDGVIFKVKVKTALALLAGPHAGEAEFLSATRAAKKAANKKAAKTLP